MIYKNGEYEAKFHIDVNNDLYMYGSNTKYSMGDPNTSKYLEFSSREFIYSNVDSYSVGYYHCVFKTNDNQLFFIGNPKVTDVGGLLNPNLNNTKYSNGPKLLDTDVDKFFCTNYSIVYSKINGDVIEVGKSSGGIKGLNKMDYTKRFVDPFKRIEFISAGSDIRIIGIREIVDNQQRIIILGDETAYGINNKTEDYFRIFNEPLDIQNVIVTDTDLFFHTTDKKLYFSGKTKFRSNNNRSGQGLIETGVDEIRFDKEIQTLYLFRNNQLLSKKIGE